MADVVRRSGGEIQTGARVHGGRPLPDGILLESAGGETMCRVLVNCARLQSDRVARRCGVDPRVSIVPFRGEYYALVPARRALVRNLIYPVPDPAFPFLGVHFTRTPAGTVEAGPNAVLALEREGYRAADVSLRDLADMARFPGFWRMCAQNWRTGLAEIRGLHQVMVEARVERAALVLVPPVPRQRHEHHVVEAVLRAEPPRELVSVHAREAEVREDEVGPVARRGVERRETVEGGLHRITPQPEHDREALRGVLVVLDDEDAEGGAGRRVYGSPGRAALGRRLLRHGQVHDERAALAEPRAARLDVAAVQR